MNKIIQLYREGQNGYSIARQLGIGYWKVYYTLKKEGIKCRPFTETNRTYEIKEYVFDNIDEEWKAYFLGLFYADGCLTKNDARICLIASDRDILDKLNKFIFVNKPLGYTPPKIFKGTNGKTYTGQPQYRLEIGNRKINESLRKHGLYERKTLTLEMPKTVPCQLMNHFIRGYFDGDGCIHKKSSWGQRFDLMGSDIFCEGMRSFLKESLNIEASIKKAGKVSRLYVHNKKDILCLYHYLYDGATIFLNRKHEVFKNIIETTDWTKVNKTKYSSFVGVSFDKRRGHWIATFKRNKRVTYLGAFLKEEDAVRARRNFESSYKP